MNEIEKIMEDLEEGLEISSQAEELLSDYHDYENKIRYVEDEPANIRKSIKNRKIGLGVLIFFMVGITLTEFIELAYSTESFFIGFVVALFFVAIFGIPIFFINRSINSLKDDLQAIEKSSDEIISNAQKEMEAIREEAFKLKKKAKEENLYATIPEDYFYSEAIEFFIGAFERKLVINMHEACRLYHQECRHQESINAIEAAASLQAERLDRVSRSVDLNTIAVLSSRYRK